MRLKICIFCLLSLCVMMLSARMSSAQSINSSTISYQGLLSNASGAPADSGTYFITVSFYSDESGTQPLWQDTFETMVRKGIFNIALGSGKTLPAPSDLDRPIWVGTRIGAMSESRPLTRLSSVPMAMNVADSSITPSKLNADYISSISVNGQKVTGHGSELNIVSGDGVNLNYDNASKSLIFDLLTGTSSNRKGANPEFVATNPCGTDSDGGDSANTVAGGCGNTIHHPIDYSSISGGRNNTITNVLGDNPLVEYNDGHVIGGGEGNLIITEINYGTENGLHGYGTIAGGQDNTLVGPVWGAIGGGDSNIISSQNPPVDDDKADFMAASVISGGQSNGITTYSLQATIGGGFGNQIHGIVTGTDSLVHTANQATIGGGESNTATNAGATIAGGIQNQATGNVSAIAGGSYNIASGQNAAIGGGTSNTASGTYSSIPGGHNLTIGDSSLGFNAGAFTDLSAQSSIAYLGNVDLWIGNVNNTARSIRFYSPNTSDSYSGAKYSSIQAGGQTADFDYILPASVPDSMGWVLGIETVSGTNIQLQWQRMDTGSGGGGGGIPAWYLSGNTLTSPGTNYLGTQDSEAFEIHVHNNTLDTSGGNQRVMQYSEGWTSPNILGGSSFNTIAPGRSGEAILSGGSKLMPNIVSDSFSVIAGGVGNIIDSGANYSSITGGRGNVVGGPFSVISGGDSNGILDYYADHNVIAGGLDNVEVDPSFGVISGGAYNYLDWDSYSSTISGGSNDSIFSPVSYVGGGYLNKIDTFSNTASIVSGERNHIGGGGNHSFVGNGFGNLIWGPFNAILSGDSNTVWSDSSVIGGGDHNNIFGLAKKSFLGGGAHNGVQAPFDVVSGGENNNIHGGSSYSVISGGDSNSIQDLSDLSTIGGGDSNIISGPRSVIGGGCNNQVFLTKWGTIAGGCGNIVTDTFTFVGGGTGNQVSGMFGTVGGGTLNQIMTITGNSTRPIGGTIGGGDENAIGALNSIYLPLLPSGYFLPEFATVAGGATDTASGHFASLGGGFDNRALGKYATIPGGTGLIALDYQTVVGRYNANIAFASGLNNFTNPGTSPPARGGTSGILSPETLLSPDAPVFIVGNGGITSNSEDIHGNPIITEVRSNAFTVSDTGYATCYALQGSGGAVLGTIINSEDATRVGTIYANNTTIAWGNVSATNTGFSMVHDIGVLKISRSGASYFIQLNVTDPGSTSRHKFTPGECAIVASISQGSTGIPGMISVQPTFDTTGSFHITTFNSLGQPDSLLGFMFHVIAQ